MKIVTNNYGISFSFFILIVPITFAELSEVVDDASVAGLTGSATCKVFCRYVYLDSDERQNFSDSIQEYLIEQVQSQTVSISGDSPTVNFNFDHHVKELIWFATNTDVINKNDFFG